MHTINDYVFTWRPEWISQFESPWSIFEKFKLANHVDHYEILRCFGSEQTKKTQTFKEKYFYLYNLATFDVEVIKKALGYDIVNENRKHINQLIGVLPYRHLKEIKGGWESVYLRDKLYFCSECLKDGYHSLFHQFKLIHKCPFHNTNLNSCCPNCGVEYLYLLANKTLESPFTCICGHQYYSPVNQFFFKSWKEYKLNNIILPEINQWLQLTEIQKLRLKNMYFIPEINFEEIGNGIERFLSLLGYEYPLPNYVDSSRFIKELKSFEEKKESIRLSKKGDLKGVNDLYIQKVRLKEFQKDFYINYKRLFAGLSKQIRNTVLLEHKACLHELKNIKRMKGKIEVCPYAFAYISWRRSFQNFTDFTEVDNLGKPNRLYPGYIELPPYMPFLSDLFLLWEEQFKDITKTSRASTKWLLNRIITHILWNHFKSWLMASEELILQGKMPSLPPIRNEKLPFFIAIFSGESNKKMEFYWWNYDSLQFTKPKCKHCKPVT